MGTLLIAIIAGLGFIIAYHTYGKWLGSKIFRLSADITCPSKRLEDGNDYIPTPKAVVFGHHFTSIAGTGPIVGPAIAVMWGWLPALLWVILGSIFIGAVHDFGSLVVSLRNNGQTVGDIAGRVINKRVRLLFLFILFMALTIILAIFGLVIASVFKQYPSAIFPCVIQIPIAVVIGVWLYSKGANLLLPSLIALALMYLSVIYGNSGNLATFNQTLAAWSVWTWVVVLLIYSYIASVLPVWTLLQPRDYINSLQLITALGLIVVGLLVAAIIGGAPPVEGAERIPLKIVAPMFKWTPEGAPAFMPFLFITIACGAISGFHCLVSSGTSSKQLKTEPEARFVGYGAMLTEGFLATLVILACVAGLGLGINAKSQFVNIPPISDDPQSGFVHSGIKMFTFSTGYGLSFQYMNLDGGIEFLAGNNVPYQIPTSKSAPEQWITSSDNTSTWIDPENRLIFSLSDDVATGFWLSETAYNSRYASWTTAKGLGAKVGAFVDGAANFLKSIGIPAAIAIALMGVLVASFAGTTLDTACRLQRYVIQELARALLPNLKANHCPKCDYNLTNNTTGTCTECGYEIELSLIQYENNTKKLISLNPLIWLSNKHGATIFAVIIAALMAAIPLPGSSWSIANAGKGGLILWPLFGATNQLLAGLAFMVITFYLRRRAIPIWFLILPMLFMLIMPMWAMIWNLFIGNESNPSWLHQNNWVLIFIGIATIALEIWMIIEAIIMYPKIHNQLETDPLDKDFLEFKSKS